jgi:hypothetical protein
MTPMDHSNIRLHQRRTRPIGVDQTALIVFWLNQLPPSAAGLGGDRWRDLTIDIVKPDGSTTTLGPFNSDPVGSSYAQFEPDQIGTYTLTFNFPGQVASLEGPTGIPGSQSAYINDNYLASTATTTLTVQATTLNLHLPILCQQTIGPPVEGQNIEWAKLVSNWLGTPQIVAKLQPEGIAPRRAHQWTQPISFGGIAGGDYAVTTPCPTIQEQLTKANLVPLILYGRLYYNLPRVMFLRDGYVCVDLRTGSRFTAKHDSTHLRAALRL